MSKTSKIDSSATQGEFEAIFYEEGSAEIGDAHHRVTAFALRHSPKGYEKIDSVSVPLKLRRSTDGKYSSHPVEWITGSVPYTSKDFLGEKIE